MEGMENPMDNLPKVVHKITKNRTQNNLNYQ